jgi:hypothetical protein
MMSPFNTGRSEVTTKCPAPDELLEFALGNNGILSAKISRHIRGCEACRERVHDLRALAAELHSLPAVSVSADCLGDNAIAALADGGGGNANRDAMAHVAGCASCRARVAAVARLMDDETVNAEIRALQPTRRLTLPRWSRKLTVTGGLAAAAVATIMLLGPERSRINTDQTRSDSMVHREPAITATAGPRVVSPVDVADVGSSLRWTSVPDADLYRVRIWNREGTVVWSSDTRDTTVALPPVISPGTSYMWEVNARTGWDRWVSSDFVEFSMRARGPR